MKQIRTIDAHVAGEPVRLVVGGGPTVAGQTMAAKLAWLRRHADELRRILMLEPRGHAGMHGALLTEPVSIGAHAGVLSMHAAGFPVLSGESIIGAATIAIENNLIGGVQEQLIFDTPAGVVRAHLRRGDTPDAHVGAVAVENVPSFVLAAGLSVRLARRAVRADIAFGGEFYAIVDSENVGIPVDTGHVPQLIAAATEIKQAVEKTQVVDGVIFTAPPRGVADLRSATVLEGGVLRRSPGVTGTCALMAVLDAMGLVAGDQSFTHEGVVGTTLLARVASRLTANDIPCIVPTVEAAAFVTGRHDFEVDERDSLDAIRM